MDSGFRVVFKELVYKEILPKSDILTEVQNVQKDKERDIVIC